MNHPLGVGRVVGGQREAHLAVREDETAVRERDWPVWAGIVLCFAVVIALTMAMDRVVFRPLRTQSAATMLVATFAVAFLLQAIALVIDQRDDTLGEPAASLARLNLPWVI
ncbi:MAG TPA: hypothetical protein VFQ08_03660, partial [Gaiella sp.]|nr:hypothetical protein [Gaiella sp.]